MKNKIMSVAATILALTMPIAAFTSCGGGGSSSSKQSTSDPSTSQEEGTYPVYSETEEDTFVKTSKTPYYGGAFFNDDVKPANTTGNDGDAYKYHDNYYIKSNGEWCKTNYSLVKDYTANNGLTMTLLSNNRYYTSGEIAKKEIPIDSDHDGIPDSEDKDNASGLLRSAFEESDVNLDYSFSVNVDYSLFDSLDNTTFHKPLAELGVMLSNAAYSDVELTNDGESTNARQTLPTLLGARNIYDVELSNTEYTVDKNDTFSAFLYHCYYAENNQTKEVFIVDFSGTANDWEWYSDFDCGDDCDAYTQRTGEHPEWRNKDNHKGYDVAINRFTASLRCRFVHTLQRSWKFRSVFH